MSRILYDQLSKQLIEEFLSPFGHVQISREVSGEPRFVDLWFEPYPVASMDPSSLGLLGRLTTGPCLIEPFRNPLSEEEMESCLLKLYSIRIEIRRGAKREKRSLTEQQLPLLWILVPTASVEFLEGLGGKEDLDGPPGVYVSTPTLHTRVVVIHQLPETEDTLWLRLLGKGRKQSRAIQDVIALSR